ncbi:MAG: hypothetical protein JNM39_16760 [Bdellovibrionaceae bacterium]|nr:hypothetical protein [Pseudobdellovibrionaceae bacterium]
MDLLQSADNPSQTSLVGDNCHITAESSGGKRFDDRLSDRERNSYPNLILLCKVHHKLVDDDEKTYTIAKLHQIKSEHELWVESAFKTLSGPDANYSRLIEIATECLDMKSWDWVTDHAIRMMVWDSLLEGINKFVLEVHRAIWPKTRPDLELEIQNLANRAEAFVEEFCKLAKPDVRNMELWREDFNWKIRMNPKYHEFSEKSEQWQNKCTLLIRDLTVALNRFSDSVRKNLKPDYMVSYGKFGMSDSQGVTNEMIPVVYFPEKYSEET